MVLASQCSPPFPSLSLLPFSPFPSPSLAVHVLGLRFKPRCPSSLHIVLASQCSPPFSRSPPPSCHPLRYGISYSMPPITIWHIVFNAILRYGTSYSMPTIAI